MIRAVKKKSYSKRKAEDYILKRKLKFIYSRLLKIFYVLLVIFLIAAAVWVLKYDGNKKISEFTYNKTTDFFISLGLKIERVEIQGNKIVPTNLILDKILASLGDVSKKCLILINLDKLEDNITSIGWVEGVEIRRKLPSTLIIKVIERTPKVIWQSKAKVWLADKQGNLLTDKMDRKYIYLPVIIGQDSLKDIPELFKIISSSEKVEKLVSGAYKIGSRRWDISLNNGIKVKLPEKNPITAWKKLEEIQNKNLIFSKKINYIDLRIEGQLVTGLEKENENEVIESKKKLELQNKQE